MFRQKQILAITICCIGLCAGSRKALAIDIQMVWTNQFTSEGRYYNVYDVTVDNASDSSTIFAIAITGIKGYGVWGSGGLKESCTWAYTGEYPDNPETGWETWSVAEYQWSGPGGAINVGWYMLNSGDHYITEINDFVPTQWYTGETYGPFCMVWWNNTHDPVTHADTNHAFIPSRILELENVSFDGFEEGDYGLAELEICVAAIVDGNVVTEIFQFPPPPAIGYAGQTEITLQPDQVGTIEINVSSTTDDPLNWTITGEQPCPWITAVDPNSGTLTSSTDTETVTININSAGLALGNYSYELTLASDIGGSVVVPVTLSVRDFVNMNEFAMLAKYWQVTDCNELQPCHEVDFYVDGNIDLFDLNQLALSWLGYEVLRKVPGSVVDNFETGDFSTLNWTLSGDANWIVTSEQAGQGVFSARSGTINHDQQCSIEITTTNTDLDTISFYRKVSSEPNYDYLVFYIDNIEQDNWSGDIDWEDDGLQTFTFTPGVHTFKWQYYKGSSASEGFDCAWIDDIMIFNAD